MHFAEKLKAYFLRFLTNKKVTVFDIKNARSVLFLRYDRIGDMVITTPVFRELKQNYPEINISVLASSINQNVLHNNPYVDKVFLNYKNNFLKDLPTLLKLRRNKYDVCVEFDHSVIPHAIIRLRIINPKKIISVFKKGRYGVTGNELKLYDFYTDKPEGAHFQKIWLNTLSPFKVKSSSNQYDLFCSDYQKEKAKNYLSLFGKKILVGINIEGAVKGKRIQLNKVQEICRGIFNINNNVQIILLSNPRKIKKISQFCQNLKLSYVVPSYKTESILDAAALIEKLDLVISPDTSIVHLASAFNKPIISIHENNKDSYQLFAPTSEINRTVFSANSKSLEGFSVESILVHANDLMKLVKSER